MEHKLCLASHGLDSRNSCFLNERWPLSIIVLIDAAFQKLLNVLCQENGGIPSAMQIWIWNGALLCVNLSWICSLYEFIKSMQVINWYIGHVTTGLYMFQFTTKFEYQANNKKFATFLNWMFDPYKCLKN